MEALKVEILVGNGPEEGEEGRGQYYEDETAPTGTCVVCIVGGESSLKEDGVTKRNKPTSNFSLAYWERKKPKKILRKTKAQTTSYHEITFKDKIATYYTEYHNSPRLKT
ncbi:hypothetical protein K2173_017962 [Erythroxylum novogranatense]|uniref:Uncharacterized protein n=1 Tax=Erythroxylum novogranatense TaxID=1862640 RepID=A0AAV8TU39_9ROSI|nr:hypothetical protein K2173_017962 [Erythroxylum novogranatense]